MGSPFFRPVRRLPGTVPARFLHMPFHMAHIGLSASLLRHEQGYRGAGVSSYIQRLLHGLAQCAGDHAFTVFHSRAALPVDGALPPSLTMRPTAWPVRHAPLRLPGNVCSAEDLRAKARRVRILAAKAKPDLAVLIPNEP